MNKTNIHFKDLLTIDNFITLKQKFVLDEAYDLLQNHHTREDIHDDLMLIKNREKAILDYNVTVEDIDKSEDNFNKYYIIPALSIMNENFLREFFKEIRDKGILTQEGLDNFKLLIIKDLNDLLEGIEKADHLGEKLSIEATKSIMDTIGLIQYYKFSELKKIPLKMSRNEIVTLFHLLLKKGFIPPRITKSELSRFIENSFQYHDFDDDKYKEIKRVVQLEHELLGDKRVRHPEKTLENLKSIFNESLFTIDKT